MTNLIDVTYFNHPRDIPNTTYDEVISQVNDLVKEYQKEYLMGILGYDTYLLFAAGLAVVAPTPIDAKWLAIRDGVTFTAWDGRQYAWTGLINADKDSPLADYVYYHWLRENQSHSSGIGETQAQPQAGRMTSSAQKQATAYNRMVKKNRILRDMLQSNYTGYPEYQNYMGYAEQEKFMRTINAYGI